MHRSQFSFRVCHFDSSKLIFAAAQRRIAVTVLSYVVCALALAAPAVRAQSNEWAWMSGTKTPVKPVYGTLGSFSSSNYPGNRETALGWTDNSGNLWLFGGDGFGSDGRSGYLNDLWEFNPTSNQWAWMGGSSAGTTAGVYGTLGVPTASNIPYGRSDAVSWKDAKGNFWMFGGYSYPSNLCPWGGAYFDDLWQFSPSTNRWTWMGGSQQACQGGTYGTLGTAAAANMPGARLDAVSWTDNKGCLWLFGGDGIDSSGNFGELNDLWMFDPSTNQWTWKGGSNQIAQSGVYGVEGTASAQNTPGARIRATGWTDSTGNLWLLGGIGQDSAGTGGVLNDLWKFNPTANQWTWMGGSSTYPSTCVTFLTEECGISGVYGTLGAASSGSFPGARYAAIGWTDTAGNLWLFGGDGIDSTGQWGYLNDLWKYSPTTYQWTWMAGDRTVILGSSYYGQPGIYGTLGTPSLGNVPSGRSSATSWSDQKGNLWLFGGQGNNVTQTWGYFEDLWEFQPNTNGQPIAATPTFSPAPGTYGLEQTVSIDDTTPGATIYYLIDGNTPGAQYSVPLTVSYSQTIQAIAEAPGYAGSNTSTASYTIQILPAATPTFSVASGTYSSAQTVTIADTTPGATIYYTTDGTAPITSSLPYTGAITVSSSELVHAIAVGSGYSDSAVGSAVFTIGSNPTLSAWRWINGSTSLNQPGRYYPQGVPSTIAMPGSRSDASGWTDHNGNFWLFGGAGTDVNGNTGYLNDLWMYQPSDATPQDDPWTWMSGSMSVPCSTILGVKSCYAQPGAYGTLGTSSSANVPGGRRQSATWVDPQGNLWLFGGYGADSAGTIGELNDLWKYDLSASQWTWMGGSSKGQLSAMNGSYGQPGVYGTLGIPSTSNIPGGRYAAATWVDKQGNFWLFGGQGIDVGDDYVQLNDLWKYNPSTGEWTWVSGSELVNVLTSTQPPSYGTKGVPSPATSPGSAVGAKGWTDGSGNLWLLTGGDVWVFYPSTGRWAWMSGSNQTYCPNDPMIGYSTCIPRRAVLGTFGVPASANDPGGSNVTAAWADSADNLWTFGGIASEVTGQEGGFFQGYVNDQWVYHMATNEWAWMGGDYAASYCHYIVLVPLPAVVCNGSQGSTGAQYQSGVGYIPSTRTGATSWMDKNGNLWLFGGYVTNNPMGQTGHVNDLWEYKPSMVTLPPAPTPIFSLQPGTYASGGPLMISNGMTNATVYYTTDGSTPTTSSNLYSGPIDLSSTETVQAIAAAPGYTTSSVGSASYVFLTTPSPPTFSVPSGAYTTVQSVAISDTAPNASIYYTIDGTAPIPSSAVYSAPLSVSSTQTVNALAAVYGGGVLNGILLGGYAVVSPIASVSYIVNLPQAAAPTFSVPAGTYTAAQTVTLSDATPGSTIYYTTNGQTPTASSSVYSTPITVSSTETLMAIAVASGYTNSPVASAHYNVNITPADFSVAASPTSLILTAGRSGTVSLSITPANGFNSAVSFTCSGLAPGASCSFSPATVSPSSGPVSTTVTIATSATSASAGRRATGPPLSGSLLAIALCCFWWKVRFRARLLLGTLSLCTVYLISSCGGGAASVSSVPSQPTNWTVTITATSGSVQHATNISLTVD